MLILLYFIYFTVLQSLTNCIKVELIPKSQIFSSILNKIKNWLRSGEAMDNTGWSRWKGWGEYTMKSSKVEKSGGKGRRGGGVAVWDHAAGSHISWIQLVFFWTWCLMWGGECFSFWGEAFRLKPEFSSSSCANTGKTADLRWLETRFSRQHSVRPRGAAKIRAKNSDWLAVSITTSRNKVNRPGKKRGEGFRR